MAEGHEVGPLPPPSESGTPSDPARLDFVPRIEGFEILGRVGEGGMGTVWRAVQLSTRRDVAIKVLCSGALASGKAQARFDREIELTARLEHPNIARIYESGSDHGVCYYAMELIDGMPLDDYARSAALSQRQTLDLMRTVCLAVQHAHQRGVIHRDLKPSNILVTPDGQPHILDFGLAKAALEDAGPAISIDGEVSGTPAYMSPEQAAGRVRDIDTRSDVYSLGVILFHLLTGRLPHTLSGTKYEVLRRIAEEEVPRPRDVSRAISRELEALLLKALAHNPDERYATAGDLAQDISNYLRGEPLRARKPTVLYFLAKRFRKHRVSVALALFIIGALLGLAVWAYVRIAREKSLAEAAAGRERLARRELEAKVLQERGDYAGAEKVCRENLAERTLACGPEDPRTLDAMGDLASALSHQRKYDEAETLHRKAIAVRTRLLGPNHPDTLGSMSDLASVLRARNRLDEAEEMYRRTLDARRRVLGQYHRDTIATMTQLAFVLQARMNHAEAEALYREALEGLRRTFGGDHPRTLLVMNSLARVLQQQAKFAEAERVLRDGLGLMRTSLGAQHPMTLFAAESLVSVLKAAGKDADADRLIAEQAEVLRSLNRVQRSATPLIGGGEEPSP